MIASALVSDFWPMNAPIVGRHKSLGFLLELREKVARESASVAVGACRA
jgi:hypothetical protein